MSAMARPDRIEGLAIVSADGMIADSHGVQPDALKLHADQRFFHAALDRATALAHGKSSGEGGVDAARRRRLVLTRRISAIERQNENTVQWNPAGATLDQAWEALGLAGGSLAVIGGTDVFGHFLEFGYDAFHLSRAVRARLPGGRPVFPGIPPQSPEQLLAAHGLMPGAPRVLDAAAALDLVTWRR
jgi:dihydrofolate reductase